MSIGKEKEYWSTTFEAEDFSGAAISSKSFDGCCFIGCNFSHATLNRCTFTDCEFLKCNLSLVKVEYSKFAEVVFRDSKLMGIDWTRAAWPRLMFSSALQFYDCIVSESSFYGLSLPEFVIESCMARHVDFRNGDFSRANFTNTDLSGAMFSATSLVEANFSGATEFAIDIFNNKLKRAKFDRFEAVRLLECVDIELV